MRSALRSATAPSAGRSRAAIAARAAARSPSTPASHAGVVRRRARGALHRRGRAHRLRAGGGDGHDQPHVPAVAASKRAGDGVAAVGALAARHLDEAAEDRSRRRARAEPGQRRQLGGRQRQPGRARGGQRQRREARGRRRQPGGGRDAVLGGDDLGARDPIAGPRAPARDRETRTRARRVAASAGAPSSTIAIRRAGAASRRSGPCVRVPSSVQRQRQAAGGGQVQRGVALAPVLHQGDVRPRERRHGALRRSRRLRVPSSRDRGHCRKPSKPSARQRASTSRRGRAPAR